MTDTPAPLTARDGMRRGARSWRRVLAACVLPLVLVVPSTSAAAPPSSSPATDDAPRAPGAQARWWTGLGTGFATAAGTRSKVWFRLADGVMSEVLSPRVDVANVRALQVVVTDGRTFTDVEETDTVHRMRLSDRRSLSFRQVNTDVEGRYRVLKTYLADPGRASVVVKITVESLDGGDYRAYVLYDPQLANSGRHDSGRSVGTRLVASDASGEIPVSSALAARPRFRATSNGFDGTSDGLTDLRTDHRMDRRHRRATDGDVVQLAELRRGGGGTSTAVVALGFGRDEDAALRTVRASLTTGWRSLSDAYRAGWHRYLDRLAPAPRGVAGRERFATRYDVALMTLRAHEDKTYRGANIASLTAPGGRAVGADEWGVGGPPLVGARELYQVATAQLAAGDRGAANRSLDYLFEVQQEQDGSFPQHTLLDGTPYVGSRQLDAVALPIVLARQLRRFDARTWDHVRRAADFLVGHGPATPREGREEDSGTAALVAAADLARRQGDEAARTLYRATADHWRNRVEERPGPSLEVTSPTADQTTAADSIEVAGTTDARAAYVHAGGRTRQLVIDPDGHFSRQVALELGANTVTVAVVGADGGTTLLQRTVTSTDLGTPLGSVEDAAGDAHGPGTTVQPAGADGAFDLRRLGVYDADDTVNLALDVVGELTDPSAGDRVALQRFDVYVRPGGSTSEGAVPARAGTNADIEAPYSFVVTADGADSAIRDADDHVVAEATVTAIPALRRVVVSVPSSAFSGINLASARYVVTAMSHDAAGGSTEESARDTGTSDPNVLDVFVRVGSDQREVLDGSRGARVDLPYVDLTE